MKIYLEPSFGDGEDEGDGGVRRVIEAQLKHLPAYGVEFVPLEEAELAHVHIAPNSNSRKFLVEHPQIPFLLSCHGLYWAEYSDWLNWSLKANAKCMDAIRLADYVTAPSEWVAQTIRRNSLRPCSAIGHGIDLEDWEVEPKEGHVLWNKTRVDPVCDPEPVGKLARMLPDIRFISTFGQQGLENLHLTGKLPYKQAQRLIQRASVYLCTARETFGIGTLEAMASGCPVVAWAWGGQREILQHKVTGWLAEPGDYDSLAEGIKYCLKHQVEMGAAARAEIIQKYQWKDVINGYADLYEMLLGQKHIQPKVSIVVPAYNLEQYFPEALDSVLQQTSKDWECIVVDDHSPDSCGEIAEGYAQRDTRFRVVHNEENQYLAGALNTGIAEAKGSYILPLDADNLLPPAAVELLTDALDHDRSIDIAYGNVEFLDEDGRRWHSGWPPKFRAEWQIQYREGQDRPPNLIPSGSMYRRKVWELTGGYRRRWRTAEDADFWTRATSYGFPAAMVTDADVLVYRNRPESMSRQQAVPDWSAWYPWCRGNAAAPAAMAFQEQPPVPSYEPVLISVIIPVGAGHEQLLLDAVDSVDAQTFRLWECIVVNDTGGELPNLPNWVKILKTRKTHGVAKARNLGIQHAAAKLFLPLDADDTLEPEALAAMFEVWQEHRGYVYSDWHEKWEDGTQKIWQVSFYVCQGCQAVFFSGDRDEQGRCPKCKGDKVVLYTEGYDANLLLTKGAIHAVTGLYPVAAWRQVGGFSEKLPAWEDWEFQLKMADIGVCGTRIPRPLFTYRKSTGSRREENYANFEKGKRGILAKWGEYFAGRKQLMACSRCPGGGGVQLHQAATPAYNGQSASPPPADLEAYDIVEYTGLKEGAINYRAPSGQMYRFAALPTERIKYVRKEDVDYFLSFTGFRKIEKEAPVAVN